MLDVTPAIYGSANPTPASTTPVAPTFNPSTSTPGLGMTPLSMLSLAGMFAGAISPQNSWQSRLGGVVSQSAQSQILAAAQQKRDQEQMKFLSEALKYYHPSVVSGLANMTAAPGILNPINGVGNPYYAPATATTGGGSK